MSKINKGTFSMILLLLSIFTFIVFGIFYSEVLKKKEPKQEVKEEIREEKVEETPEIKEEIEKHTVVLDAAFGGELEGYVGIVKEADLNAEIVDVVKAKLEEDERIDVILSHENNESASVESKAERINEINPELLITICAANSDNASESGMHIYADKPTAESFEKSLNIAECVQKEFTSEESPVDIRFMYYEPIGNNIYQIKYVDIEDKDDKKLDTWLILEKTECPAIVVEQMYVTSQNDIDKWTSKEGLDNIAESYYKATLNYLGLD